MATVPAAQGVQLAAKAPETLPGGHCVQKAEAKAL